MSESQQKYVVIEVVSANITKNINLLGRMDPYVVVSWLPSVDADAKDKTLVSRTHTDWDAHKTPKWDFTCRGHPHSPGSGEGVELALFEDDGPIGKITSMGSAVANVDDLLGPDPRVGAMTEERELSVIHRKKRILGMQAEQTGTITVRAHLMASGGGGNISDAKFTKVDATRFQSPVKRLGVSGGTAPFFSLVLADPSAEGKSEGHFIGKDLSRAVDEIAFYEELLSVVNSGHSQGLRDLLAFAFEYAGVLRAPEEGVAEDDPNGAMRELLVLRNLRDGCKGLRLLDLKMGEKTASANWHGKSRLRAYKQGLLDKTTNSHVEGYRLEGFDGKPKTLETRDPLLDFEEQKSEKSKKKAGRLLLQHMEGQEIMMHFLDLHLGATADSDADLAEVYSAAELGELVCYEVTNRLANLCAICQNVSVPQKWVGSSVALGYDCGALPPRSRSAEEIKSSVIVNIFDWGRSELNTLEKKQHQTAEEQQDRAKFWGYYKGGVERLGWVAANAYMHRFGNAVAWKAVTLGIYDFDAMSKDDFMAKAVVPVEETEETTISLSKMGGGDAGTLTYSMHWRPCPAGSRLKGTWRVCIKSAKDLPNTDEISVSDPYCCIQAASADGRHSLEAVTRILPNELSPVWEETIDLPIAANADALVEALQGSKTGLGDGDLSQLFPVGNAGGGFLKSSTVSGVNSTRLALTGVGADPGFPEWVERLRA